ncbi:MAG: hypothetical protein HY216_00930 [Candidatus Rokubacteria bacterium]|nr:hypothetical protein [Candidatus Rokubacteria bacterium]
MNRNRGGGLLATAPDLGERLAALEPLEPLAELALTAPPARVDRLDRSAD